MQIVRWLFRLPRHLFRHFSTSAVVVAVPTATTTVVFLSTIVGISSIIVGLRDPASDPERRRRRIELSGSKQQRDCWWWVACGADPWRSGDGRKESNGRTATRWRRSRIGDGAAMRERLEALARKRSRRTTHWAQHGTEDGKDGYANNGAGGTSTA
ncbi:hypothetical protein Syun_025568 [Stephania yunnanensis]|uniref:Uncharacterized protein n=1 Tax=Stephania yunnanensis TaxID=152371 RepID=A0AAP0EXF7_9MAGN